MDDARRAAILARYAARVGVFEEIASHHPRTHVLGVMPATASASLADLPPTEREVTVLGLIADGASNAEIGQELHITEETVKSHVRHLLLKLSAHNRAHAVALGYQRGLLDLPRAA